MRNPHSTRVLFGLTATLATLAPLAGSARAQTAQSAPAAIPAPSNRLTLEQYFDLEDVNSPQLSPDGREVIYTRRNIDKLNDRWESSLWMVGTDGAKNRFLVKGSNAVWSSDGTRIAYVAPGEPAGAQVFVRWMDAEGAKSQITHVDQSPSDLEWSPDGKWLLFTMNESVPSPSAVKIKMPAPPKGAKWIEPPTVVTRLRWRADRQGIFPDAYRQVWVVPADGGTPRKLTNGAWSHSDPHWTANGREIVFVSHRVDESEYWPRESENLRRGRRHGRHPADHAAPGPRQHPTPVARRQVHRVHELRLHGRHVP